MASKPTMRKLSSLLLFSALLAAASSTFAAGAAAHKKTTAHTSKSVSYTCQSGKTLKVTYGFNRQGIPTHASAFMGGKTRYMPINLNRSDNVDTIFGDENNYSLSTSYMDRANYARQPVMVTDPAQEIVYKDCSPAALRQPVARESAHTVRYACDQGKALEVTYGFNRQGLPTFARARMAGKSRYMPINRDRSDNVDTVFGSDHEYRVGSSYMDSRNFRAQPILVTDPADRIVFKNCSPRR